MPWFWGSSKKEDNDDNDDDDYSEEDYSDDEESYDSSSDEHHDDNADAEEEGVVRAIVETVETTTDDDDNDDDDDDNDNDALNTTTATTTPPQQQQQQQDKNAAAAAITSSSSSRRHDEDGDDLLVHDNDHHDDSVEEQVLASFAIPQNPDNNSNSNNHQDKKQAAILTPTRTDSQMTFGEEGGENVHDLLDLSSSSSSSLNDSSNSSDSAGSGDGSSESDDGDHHDHKDNNNNHNHHESDDNNNHKHDNDNDNEAVAATTTTTTTSLQEKQSLLVLAAEHDRVDILQAILTDETLTQTEQELLLQGGHKSKSKSSKSSSSSSNNSSRAAAEKEEEEDHTHTTTTTSAIACYACIPPLHIAVSYGSLNATNCLLRMGADPSIVPNVAAIQQAQAQQAEQQQAEHVVVVAHMHQYDGMSAWELVFGKQNDNDNNNNNKRKQTNSISTKIPLSKKEGLRHAFTAEALRCIGSDEVERLQQLIQAGMPASIDIGGKTLQEWAVDMNATKCQQVFVLPSSSSSSSNSATAGSAGKEDHNNTMMMMMMTRKESIVLDRPGGNEQEQTISQLYNRLDELESLSKALSACLDNLGEEVAVCSGLLLVGSGATALASHVRSLKTTKRDKYDEWLRNRDAWENSQDELAYWVREAGAEGERIASQMTFVMADTVRESRFNKNQNDNDNSSGSSSGNNHERQQLLAQIAASENKIRMLRLSIADLSEENARNLVEVERRGLSGGINLVRSLREEIRDIEFQLNEAKSGDAECRTKISLIQSKLRAQNGKVLSSSSSKAFNNNNHEKSKEVVVQSAGLPSYDVTESTQTAGGLSSQEEEAATAGLSSSEKPRAAKTIEKDSERIAQGHSTALAIREGAGSRGFFPLSLWQILMRIIGIRDDSAAPLRYRRSNSRGQPALVI